MTQTPFAPKPLAYAPDPTLLGVLREIEETRTQLAGYLKDWKGFLLGQLPQAQQALRRLIKGRLTFTPHEDGYTFEGVGTLVPVLGGAVRKLASPTGFAVRDQRQFYGIWRSDRRAA